MIIIGSDHGGVELKENLIKYLKSLNMEVLDIGTNSDSRTDYPIYAKKLAENFSSEDKGILICKSGHGMNIAANKFKNIYASICYSKSSVKKAVEDDNINVCVLPADDLSFEESKEIVLDFLNLKFKDGRYLERFNMVKQIEEENFN